MTENKAWVTLATNDSYALGALVLAHSLKLKNTIYQIAVLVTPGVSPAMRSQLASVFNLVQEVDVLDSKDDANLALISRPELGITFTKLHCWNLTQYSKCVFLDADTLVIQNSDELFEREELSAAPDAGWPDCFNSGVFVFSPSKDKFKALLEFALTNGSFDGGDQGLLNSFFSDWATKDITRHLPFIYNMVSTAAYSYLPAFKFYGNRVKIVHFIGNNKPWLQCELSSQTLSPYLELWWKIFNGNVSKNLSREMINNSTVFGDGRKNITPPPTPDTRHVFVDPWELPQEQLIPKSKPKLKQEDVVQDIVDHIRLSKSHDLKPEKLLNRSGREKFYKIISQHSDNRYEQTYKETDFQNTKQGVNKFYNQENGLSQETNGFRLENDTHKVETQTIAPPIVQICLTDCENNKDKPMDIQKTGLAGALAGGDRSAIEDQWRKQNWEQGVIDYMGKDSFQNIWQKISETIGLAPKQEEPIKPSEVPSVPKEPLVPEVPKPEEAKAQETIKTDEKPLTESTEKGKTVDDKKEPLASDLPQPPTAPADKIKPPRPTVEIPPPQIPTAETKPQTPTKEGKPQTPVAEVKPQTPVAEAKPQTPTSEAKPQTPAADAKPQTPTVEAKPQTPTEAKPQTPIAEAKPQTPTVEAKPQTPTEAKPQTPIAEAKPQTPTTEAKPQTPTAEVKPLTPTAEAKPQIPTAEAPQVPTAEVPPTPTAEAKPSAPTEVAKPQTPTTEAKPQTPAAEVKPQTPTAEVKPQTPTTEPSQVQAVAPASEQPPVLPDEPKAPESQPKDDKKDDSKPPEPPKDGGAEKVVAPISESKETGPGSPSKQPPVLPAEPKAPESQPKDDKKDGSKPPEPPKDGGAEKVVAPISESKETGPGSPVVTAATPASPSGQGSPPFPEEAKLQVATTDPLTPPPATSSATAEAPVPPKRKGNQKGNGKPQGGKGKK